MAKQNRSELCLDLAEAVEASRVLPEGPLLRSEDTWRGIYLAEYCHGAAEAMEHRMASHVLDLPIGSRLVGHERWLDGRLASYQQQPGELDFCPAGASHRAVWADQVQFVLVVIEPWFVERVAAELEVSEDIELVPQVQVQSQLLQQLTLALRGDVAEGYPAGAMYGEVLGRSLVMQLLRVCGEQRLPVLESVGLSRRALAAVEDYVEAHLACELRLGDLAAVAHLSPAYFCRCFKRATGLAPHQFVVRRRVARAKGLLGQGELSLVEVALACGFGSQSLLNRHFKRVVGMTPRQWQKL